MKIKTLAYIHRILSSQERVLQKLYEKDVENNAGESAISMSFDNDMLVGHTDKEV